MRMVLILLATLSQLVLARTPSNAILLSTVKSLTLRGDALTTARRVKAIPQLTCVGGNARGYYDVDVMRCQNTGSEYGAEDISWTCHASLPPEFKLGSTEVICEGYSSSDDPYILKGSCGVEYRLVLTNLGESKYGRYSQRSSFMPVSSKIAGLLYKAAFWLVFLGIVGFFIYKLCIEGDNIARGVNGRPRRGYGGGGGWGGDDNDPPPPYSRRPARSAPKSQYGPSQGGWRPGFWSGAAAGAAAGYAMGGRNTQRDQTAQAGPSNWYNPAGANTATTNAFSGSGQTSNPTPSNSRYDSTGFGGTRRR